jgi:hypothetical protein
MRWYFTWLIVVVLAGCSSSKDSAAILSTGVPPDYKDQILLVVPKLFADPTNIKDAFVSIPFQIKIGNESRDVICLRGNPRIVRGQYSGSRDMIVYFFNGQINQIVRATPEQCGHAPYKPFPELEKYCRGNKCL